MVAIRPCFNLERQPVGTQSVIVDMQQSMSGISDVVDKHAPSLQQAHLIINVQRRLGKFHEESQNKKPAGVRIVERRGGCC